jgi:ABC-2 type transport system permease protein
VNVLAIAAVNVQRLLRDRTGLFFVFVLPIVLIVVLGTMYGGRVAPRMGIVAIGSGALGAELVDAIRDGGVKLELKEPATIDELRARVEDGTLEIGVIVPPGYDATLRGGGVATVTILGQGQSAVSALREAVDAAIAGQAAAVGAARLAASRGGIPFDEALVTARRVQGDLAGVAVAVERSS